uniref:CRAL-TRIO domain-containing protein n=1 Tax=Trichuris muris TaxID=70415 RepID=A0A5S6QGM2_TRIMR
MSQLLCRSERPRSSSEAFSFAHTLHMRTTSKRWRLAAIIAISALFLSVVILAAVLGYFINISTARESEPNNKPEPVPPDADNDTIPGCFPAGSIVRTRAGWIAIEDLQIGDEVLDVTSHGQLVYSKVYAWLRRDNLNHRSSKLYYSTKFAFSVTSTNMIPGITAVEEAMIEQIRKELPDINNTNITNGSILRWLRSASDNLSVTMEALRKHLIFRKAWGLDDLLTTWKKPEVLMKYYGHGLPGTDREGSPILFTLLGNTDVEGLFTSCQSQDFVKMSLTHIEEALEKAEEAAKKNGKPYEKVLLIIDLDNMTTSHYTFKPFTCSYLTLLALFQDNYPGVFKKIIVIKAPTIAKIAYNLLLPFLSSETEKLIEMSSDAWKESLFQHIDPDQWPAYWGGNMKDENGDEKCPDKIVIGQGPVPQSYKYDESTDRESYTEVTVYAGHNRLVEIRVDEAGSELYWKYKTTGEDIGFAVYFTDNDEAADTKSMEPLFPYIRFECALVPIEGALVCEKEGRYIVEFDNCYSWFSAKELSYVIRINKK